MDKKRVIVINVILAIIVLILSFCLIKDSPLVSGTKKYDCKISIQVQVDGFEYASSDDIRTNDTVRIKMEGLPDDIDVEWSISAQEVDCRLKFIGNQITLQFPNSCKYLIQGLPDPNNPDVRYDWREYNISVKNRDESTGLINDHGMQKIPLIPNSGNQDIGITIINGISTPEIDTTTKLTNVIGTFDIHYNFIDRYGHTYSWGSERIRGVGDDHVIHKTLQGIEFDDVRSGYDYIFQMVIEPVHGSYDTLDVDVLVIY